MKPVDVDQQSHMITHLAGISAPMHTHDTMEMGMVLCGFGKLKPVPIPVHTHDTLSWVYLYPCHALEIIAQPRTHSFTLQLPEHLHAIYPVFYVSQLEPLELNTIPN